MASGIIRASMRLRNFFSITFSSSVNSAIWTTSSWLKSIFIPNSASVMAFSVPTIVAHFTRCTIVKNRDNVPGPTLILYAGSSMDHVMSHSEDRIYPVNPEFWRNVGEGPIILRGKSKCGNCTSRSGGMTALTMFLIGRQRKTKCHNPHVETRPDHQKRGGIVLHPNIPRKSLPQPFSPRRALRLQL